MAFVTPIPEEQQNQFAPSGQTTPNPLALLPPQTSGGSAGQGGGGASGSTPGVGTPTQFGSSASRLSDYLQANQDQVQQMANQISGQIGNQYNTVKSGVDQAAQQFGQQVQSSYTPTDPTLLNQVQTDPGSVANDPTKLSAWQKQFNSSYTGPSSFQGSTQYQGAQQKVQDAMQQADLLGTYPGLSQYLQSNVERNATPGQNTLDTVLLQSHQPAFQTVQQAAAPFQGLDEYLSGITDSQNQAVQAAQAAAPAARQAAQQALQSATTPLVQSLNTAYQQGTQGATNYNNMLNSIAEKISNGNYGALTAQEQSLIGYNPAATSLFDKYSSIFPSQAANKPINFSQYFTQGEQSQVPTPENIVTPEQIATWQALTTLGGNAPTGLNFSMPSQSVPLQGQTGAQPGVLPQYNTHGALGQIYANYAPMYDQLAGVGFSGVSQEDLNRIQPYMASLREVLGMDQPPPQPTVPMPEPGTNGDIGSGFHWDPDAGAWIPNINLMPPGYQRPPGGGGPIFAPGIPGI